MQKKEQVRKRIHRGRMEQIMKKLLSLVLCLCLLSGIAALSEEEDEDFVLLIVENHSDLEISYLRFNIYRGDEPAGIVVSCPNEGEDFYRCPYTPESQEELDELRIEYSDGISDLSPEEAVLQLMMGNPAEEHPLPAPELTLRYGETCSLELVNGPDGYMLQETGKERNDREESAAQEPDPENLENMMLDRMIQFLLYWSRDEYDTMLDMCTTEWKAGTDNPKEALLEILDDRRPYTCTPEAVSGTEGDEIRTVTVRMDIRKTDKAKEHDYLFHITLQREEDGLWRIDPGSLLDYGIADAE